MSACLPLPDLETENGFILLYYGAVVWIFTFSRNINKHQLYAYLRHPLPPAKFYYSATDCIIN